MLAKQFEAEDAQSHDGGGAVAADEDEKEQTARRPFWQWVILYPSLFVSLAGAVPTVIEAVQSRAADVPWGHSSDARDQKRLWEANFECARTVKASMTTTKKMVQIGILVCDSGDVLLIGHRPESDAQQYRWVSWTDIASASGGKGQLALAKLLGGWAFAAEPGPMAAAQAQPQQQSTVLCQKWIGDGQLLRRIQTPSGCFDQTINAFNGRVVLSKPAPCNSSC